MKDKHKIILVSVILAAFVWIGDAAVDYAFAAQGSFINRLIYDVPQHRIFARAAASALFLIYGALALKILGTRNQTKEALQRSNRIYRTLLENLPQKVFYRDKTSRYLTCNSSYARDFNITQDQIVGKTDFDLFPRELAQEYQEEDKRIMKLKGVEVSYAVYPPERIVQETKTPVRDEQGNVIGLLGIFWDVTDYRRMEDALKESEERWRSVVENAPNMILIVDRDGTIEFVNRTVSGFSIEDAIGTTVYEYTEPEYRNTLKETIEHVFRTGQTSSYQIKGAGPDGKEAWYEGNVGPIKHGGQITAVTLIVTDITERKRAVEAQRLQSEITANMSEGVYLVRASDGIIVYTNPKFEQLFGYGPGEMIGKHVSIVNAPTEKTPEETARAITETLNKYGRWQGEIKNIKKDGTPFWSHANVSTFDHPEHGRVWVTVHVDITDRKQTEEALRQSEARYRGLYESSRDGIVSNDMQGNLIAANQAFLDMLGYTLEEFKKVTYAQITPDKWHQTERDIVTDQVMPRGYSNVYEKEYIRKDGTIFPAAMRLWLTVDEKGKPISLSAAIRDITKRKQAEEALRQSEERFRSLVETTSDWVWEVDINGVYTYSSPKVQDLLGYEPKEVIGKTPFDFMTQEEAERVAARFREIVASKQPFAGLENISLHKDGHYVVLETSGVPLFDADQNLTGYRGIDRDMTDRKRAEEAIRKLSSAVEQSIDGIAIGDLESRLTYVNDAFARMHGYRPDEMTGMSVANLHSQEQIKDFEKARVQVRTQGSWEGELGHMRKDGTAFSTYISVTSLRDERGERLGFLGICSDITELKQAQAELLQAEKLAAIGTMVAAVAHELNNPLASIIGFGQLLAKQENKITEQGREDLQTLLASAEQCRNIVQNLTSFTRKDVGKKENADISKLLHDGVAVMRQALKNANIQVKQDVPHGLWANVLPRSIEQVFVNVIKNAAEAMGAAHGKGVLQIRANTVGDEIQVEIEDDGPGIDEPKRIFDPFYTTKEPGQGTGLGLPVSQRIVTDHGGTISSINTGHGALFKITLPATAAPGKEVKRPC